MTRNEYQVLDVADGFLSLMTNDGGTKDDCKVPEGDIGNEITKAFEDGKDIIVTVVTSMGEEMVLAWKEGSK